ncbi:hypothetical protein RUM44_005436 [Polyplax serrata]|uniref:Monocarboxylate transporter 9 n=1 Tax=Polyplax serrata TaxID=468196 RepID=A0ABR1AW28_POLSC
MRRRHSDDLKIEKIIVVPPDGGWGWVVVVAAFVCILIMDGISNTFGLLIPIFEKEFNASVSQVSLINSLFTGFYFIFAPVAGSLSNRFGFRPVIIAGSVISSFGLAISIFTDSVHVMFATYGLIGDGEHSQQESQSVRVESVPSHLLLLWKSCYKSIHGDKFLLDIQVRRLEKQGKQKPNLEETDGCEKYGKQDKAGRSMHNARYPTAAEAIDINQLRGSKMTLLPSRMTSFESFEIFKPTSKEHSSRNSELKRRTTEFSQFQSMNDLTVNNETLKVSRCQKFWKTCCCCGFHHSCQLLKKCGKNKVAGVRPMYRDDIFYDGSIVHLPTYDRSSKATKSGSAQQSATIKSSLLYHLSVSRLPTHRDLQQERDEKCHLFPESMTRALKTMFDFRVIKYSWFLFFTISTCFLAVGINAPSYFTYVRALEFGVMSQSDASLILSAFGVTNTIGRIICGLIATLPKIDVVILHFVFLFFGALLNVCVVFMHSKEAFFIYAALYGFVLAEQGSLRSVILVKLVGLENLTNAFGILLLFLGIFTVAGTPAAGYMKEVTGSYDAVFIFSALFLLLAALFLIPIFTNTTHCKRIGENSSSSEEENQIRELNSV